MVVESLDKGGKNGSFNSHSATRKVNGMSCRKEED
jgi:hypothetical protein